MTMTRSSPGVVENGSSALYRFHQRSGDRTLVVGDGYVGYVRGGCEKNGHLTGKI